MRSKTYMSKINLQRGKLTVENRKSREKKRKCSEVSVNSPGNPWSQSRRRNGRLCYVLNADSGRSAEEGKCPVTGLYKPSRARRIVMFSGI